MTTDSKSQPTGWVVVDFEDDNRMIRDRDEWRTSKSYVRPFSTEQDARWAWEETFVRGTSEVHPWPLPASVLARLKERHPTVDWSQVPVAKPTHAIGCHDGPTLSQYMADRLSVEAEKPGRWVLFDSDLETGGINPFRDQDGWSDSPAKCCWPWGTSEEVASYARDHRLDASRFVPVNLDDLPAPAVDESSEVEKLRGALRAIISICGGSTTDRVSTEFLVQTPIDVRICVETLRTEVERLTRERDEAREELSRCKQAHSAAEDDVESLREQFETMSRHADQQRLQIEQLGKARLSRRDEFAKAALTGLLADPEGSGDHEFFATEAVLFADATIRALDGAGGA